MLVELRPRPGGDPADPPAGGQDEACDLVVHDVPDGNAWALENDHAAERPDLIAL